MLRTWMDKLFEIWPSYFPEDPSPSLSDFLFLTASTLDKGKIGTISLFLP
jgi:hypothetical protein